MSDNRDGVDRAFEIDKYSLVSAESSHRIRWLLSILVIGTILVFTGIMNSRRKGWINNRVHLARVALCNEVWKPLSERHACRPISGDSPEEIKRETEEIKTATDWAAALSLDSKDTVKHALEVSEELQIQNAYTMRMPILGLSFHVNDLGTFSGIAFVLLLAVLVSALSRDQQNLYLCLWKVRAICDQEKGFDNKDGQANLLYHILAMRQLISQPPTLARWRQGIVRHFRKLFFLPPVVMQFVVAWTDYDTFPAGVRSQGRTVALLILSWEWTAAAIALACAVVCCLYVQAADTRWRNTFKYINPEFWRSAQQPSWFRWIWPRSRKVGPPASEK